MDRIFVQHIVLFSLVVATTTQMFADVDYPCNPKWHAELNEHYRNTGFDTRSGDTPMCDNNLKKGWYKFVDATGAATEMATRCPGTNTCGTATPVWMNGSHPQENDGIVGRRVCGMMSDNKTSSGCCDYQDDLFVKNCSGFYVYYLSPTSSCPSSYCAGTARRCAVGKWSNTSLEPCRDLAPVLTTPPFVKGPIVGPNQTVNYECHIEFGPNDPDQVFQVEWTFNNQPDPSIKPDILIGSQKVATLSADLLQNHLDTDVGCQVITYYIPEKNKNTYNSQTSYFGVQHVNLTGPNLRGNQSFDFECDVTTTTRDTNQKIEVVWTFDGQRDPRIEPQVITGGAPTATLDGSAIQGHINSHVGCEARLIYEGHNMKSEFRQSNTYFAGIQVDPVRLEISDSEGEKTFTVISTIPVVCDQAEDCCLTFKMEVDKKKVVSLKDSCDHKLCLADWQTHQKRASFNVTVVPSRNAISGGTREAVVSFTDLVISGTGRYLDIFNSSRPDPVQIVVKLEAGFRCSITGDPHFQGFDYKRIYDLYQTGDYTVYAVKDRDFLVQIRSWPCWAVTCVCGVVVRERDDVIKVYGCETHGDLVSSTVDVPYPLSPGTVVRRSSNGRHVGILLPSGSEIKIDISTSFMDVYIQTPAYDRNKAMGICGTNDGNPDNDFTHPDGTVTPVCSNPGRCVPTTFTESWRVSGAASMFVTSPKQVSEKRSEEYCSCSTSSGDRSARACSPRQHVQETDLACKNCPEITHHLKPSPWGQPGQTDKPYTHKEVKYVNPDKQWPNDQGITESQAKDMCRKAIEKSQLYQQCKDMDNLVNTAMAECLGDILDGGTNDNLPAVTSSFTNKCQMNAAGDYKNYQPDSDGGMALDKQFSEHVCPPECMEHGTCAQNGTCVCQTGWQGDVCQVETGRGPQITWTSGSPWCDMNQMSCQHFQFDKSNVNIHDKLRCRVQPVDSQGNATGQPLVVDAEGDASSRVVCPLPRTNQSAENYTVSVTSDGTLYGNELNVYTFDSTCLDCMDAGCSLKKTGCHINNICYSNGDRNIQDGQLVCDTSRRLTDWSLATELTTAEYRTASIFYDGTSNAETVTTPAGATLVETTVAGTTPSRATPSGTTPVETTLAEITPAETTTAEIIPAEITPAETTTAETTTAETTPAEITPAETTTAETTTAETTPAEITPAETTPAETTTAETTTAETTPAETTTAETTTAETTPAEITPAETTTAETTTAETTTVEITPVETTTAETTTVETTTAETTTAETTTAEITLAEITPAEITLAGITPATNPVVTTPGGTTADGTTPGGASAGGTTPGGTNADGTTPGGTTADGTTPGWTSADGTTPGWTSADGTTPGGTTADGTTPGWTSAGGKMPDGTTPAQITDQTVPSIVNTQTSATSTDSPPTLRSMDSPAASRPSGSSMPSNAGSLTTHIGSTDAVTRPGLAGQSTPVTPKAASTDGDISTTRLTNTTTPVTPQAASTGGNISTTRLTNTTTPVTPQAASTGGDISTTRLTNTTTPATPQAASTGGDISTTRLTNTTTPVTPQAASTGGDISNTRQTITTTPATPQAASTDGDISTTRLTITTTPVTPQAASTGGDISNTRQTITTTPATPQAASTDGDISTTRLTNPTTPVTPQAASTGGDISTTRLTNPTIPVTPQAASTGGDISTTRLTNTTTPVTPQAASTGGDISTTRLTNTTTPHTPQVASTDGDISNTRQTNPTTPVTPQAASTGGDISTTRLTNTTTPVTPQAASTGGHISNTRQTNPTTPVSDSANTSQTVASTTSDASTDPSSVTTEALSRRNKRILKALEKFVARVKSLMDRLKNKKQ